MQYNDYINLFALWGNMASNSLIVSVMLIVLEEVISHSLILATEVSTIYHNYL